MIRLNCLDGLRGLLALYVLLVHTLPWLPLPVMLAWPLAHGEAAVDLFFVLSGLVIAASVEHFEYRATPFLIARAARIFPVFVPVFVLAMIVQPVAVDFTALPWIEPTDGLHELLSDGWPPDWGARITVHLGMLHGLFPAGILPDVWVSFLGSAWSLSTEWQFYALVALIGARLGRGQTGLWRLTLLLLAMGTAGVLWQAVASPDWQFTRAFLPNKAPYFALGVASAALLRDPAAWLRFGAVMVVALILCVAHDNPLKLLVPLIWLLCLLAQMARTRVGPVWLGLRTVGWVLESAPLRWLGGVSYSLYLVNEPLQKLLGVGLASIAGQDALTFTLLWLPSGILLPLGAAWWLRKRVELPALRIGRTWAHEALTHAIPVRGGALAPAWAVVQVGAALPRPLSNDRAGQAMAEVRLARDFELMFAPRDHLATYSITPDPRQVLAQLGGEARRIVLSSSIVVWLSIDAVEAARQRARLERLCARRCPYRPGADLGGDDTARCRGAPDECRRWLAQHGIAGVDPRQLDHARADAMRELEQMRQFDQTRASRDAVVPVGFASA